MKNILQHVLKQNPCILCGTHGYFCESSMGRCGPSCPCCGYRHFLDWADSATYRARFDWDDASDVRNQYLYCKECGIVFALGCLHYEAKFIHSEDRILNAHFITKWKHRDTQEVFRGMPYFENPDDWFEHVNQVEVLEMQCPQSNLICNRSRRYFQGDGCPLVGSL
jgi:hypothetical protein